MMERLNAVFSYLENKVADLYDINHGHVKIKSISIFSNEERFLRTREIIFTIDDGKEKTAYWKEYDGLDGSKCDVVILK